MQLTPVFTHTASEVFKLLSQIMLQIDTSLKKTRESLKGPMAKRLSLDQPNDSFAQSKEYICIIFHFMGLIRLINLAMLIQSIKMKAIMKTFFQLTFIYCNFFFNFKT